MPMAHAIVTAATGEGLTICCGSVLHMFLFFVYIHIFRLHIYID